MPTYVYGCDACGHRFEKFQKFSDEPVRICPECGNQVRRIFQPAGIVFKGSGWHVNDYKRNGGDAANSSKAKGAEADDGKAAEGEAKPETKAADSKGDAATSTTASTPSAGAA